jgi:hypothetical protein
MIKNEVRNNIKVFYYNFYIMTDNIKITEIEKNTEKIQKLIEQIKDELMKKEKERNAQIKKLKKIIHDYSHENTSHFTSSYNVGRLKAIVNHLYEIILKQDERISELERK